MKIEEGKYYRRLDGKIVGPGIVTGIDDKLIELDGQLYMRHGELGCKQYGRYDLVEEVPDPTAKPSSPVRTVIRKEIVPGTYGPLARLNIETRDGEQSETYIDLDDGWYPAADIREFARLLNEISDAMEEQS